MRLTVGEISKVLGLPSESIRYYVREGLIRPEKNTENNYWEYSSEDLRRLFMHFSQKEEDFQAYVDLDKKADYAQHMRQAEEAAEVKIE